MKVFTDTHDAMAHGSVCAIGSFDGVHRGHQAIVDTVHTIAGSRLRTGIITFIPLPFFVLKGLPPMYLTTRSEKEHVFAALDMGFIHYFTFDREFSHLKPEVFIQRLANELRPAHIVVGANFHFGAARSGSADRLVDLARGLFEVHIVDPVKDNGVISSTRIRELLLLGNVAAANELLGREYSLNGRVEKGKGRGSTLGFPTVNIHAAADKLLPLDGVYVARVRVDNETHAGALFLHHDLVEVHILDHEYILYGQEITVCFVKRIRNIESFPDDRALAEAIANDVKQVRAHCKGKT